METETLKEMKAIYKWLCEKEQAGTPPEIVLKEMMMGLQIQIEREETPRTTH